MKLRSCTVNLKFCTHAFLEIIINKHLIAIDFCRMLIDVIHIGSAIYLTKERVQLALKNREPSPHIIYGFPISQSLIN